MAEIKKPIFSAAKRFEEGVYFAVSSVKDIAGIKVAVECSEGASRAMNHHALRGLPVSEGGNLSEEAVEVKGWLLGTVRADGEIRSVRIKDALQLPFNPQDAGDAAYFSAKDRAALEHELSRHPELQMVGNYHSHPNHEIKLSEQDVEYLTQYLIEPYQVAAIAGPREGSLGFFLKNEDGCYVPRQNPEAKVPFSEDGRPVLEGGGASGTRSKIIPGVTQRVERAVGITVGICLIALFVILKFFGGGPERPMLKVPEVAIAFDSEFREKRIVLKLDKEGSIAYTIDSSSFPDWLVVEPAEGVVDYGPGLELLVAAEGIGSLPRNKPEKYNLIINWQLDLEGEEGFNAETIEISAVNTIPEKNIPTKKWEKMPKLIVRNGKFQMDLRGAKDLSQDGGPVSVRLRFKRKMTNSKTWEGHSTQRPGGNSWSGSYDFFGDPLEWSELSVTATVTFGVQDVSFYNKYTYEGTTLLKTKLVNWELDYPTEDDAYNYTFVTTPLGYPANVRYFKKLKGKNWGPVGGSISLGAGKTHSISQPFDAEIEVVKIAAGVVGKNSVYRREYEFLFTVRAEDDGEKDPSAPVGILPDTIKKKSFDALGKNAKVFRMENDAIYSQLQLDKFGVFGGPKYFFDIDESDRVNYVFISQDSEVQDFWAKTVEWNRSLEGKGEFSWAYLEATNEVALLFVIPEGLKKAGKESLMWLAEQDAFVGMMNWPADGHDVKRHEGTDPSNPVLDGKIRGMVDPNWSPSN